MAIKLDDIIKQESTEDQDKIEQRAKEMLASTDNITKLPEPEVYAPKAGELQERIENLLGEYAGEIGFAEVIGVLEIVKIVYINDQ